MLATEKSTGKEYAAKQCACRRLADRKNVELEVEIMKELNHPMLVQLVDGFYKPGSKGITLILEL